jgi:hypothetical protein
MVAGRRLWGEDEQQPAQHHAARGGDLGVVALGEDGVGTREARQLGGRVEAGRPVDEEDDPDAEGAEQEDRSAQAGTVAAPREHRQAGGQQGDRDQRIGVGVDRGLEPDFGGARHSRQPGVAWLAHLDPAVVDELGGDQAGGGSDDHAADRPLGSDHGARPRCLSRRLGGGAAGAALGEAEAAQKEDRKRPQPPAAPAGQAPGAGVERPAPAPQPPRNALPGAAGVAAGADERRLGRPQQPIDAPIDPACPLHE